jgi:hypothetical protein
MFAMAFACQLSIYHREGKTHCRKLAANDEVCKVSIHRNGNTNADGPDFDNGCLLESDSMKRFFLLFVVFSSVVGCRPEIKSDTVAIRELPDESIAITRTRFWKEYEVNPVRAEEMLKISESESPTNWIT